MQASLSLFTILISLAITGAAVATIVLLILIIIDWRKRSIW